MFKIQDDGITHINIYSRGQTPLGQRLSNFYRTSIEMDGRVFNSVEAYWYWYLCDHPNRDSLCELHGYKAKQEGRRLRGPDWPKNNDIELFRTKIAEAFIKRVQRDKELREWLKESTLPLVHYYENNGKITVPYDSVGICSIWESIRRYLQIGNK